MKNKIHKYDFLIVGAGLIGAIAALALVKKKFKVLVIDKKVFKLRLLPSGIVRDGKISILGNGVVIDPWALLSEIEEIRKKGLAKASKKSDREANEGAVGIYSNKDITVLIKVNSETDFAAKSDTFLDFLDNLGNLVLKNKIPNDQVTYIFDNEPRNKEIIKRMYSVVEKDYNLVVWPDDMRHKDINDIIISGTSKAELLDLLNKNTYSKLSALTKLNEYKKV